MKDLEVLIERALDQDGIIDITTRGRHSGLPRRIEIWFRRVAGKLYITGTPGPRGWYANLLEEPRFVLHFKAPASVSIEARARPVMDMDVRRQIFAAPEMRWYRDHVASVSELVDASPLVEVELVG